MKEDPDIFLKLKKSSWDNFFRVMKNRKNTIELIDGSSLGNFHACIQYLEQQFEESIKVIKCPKCGKKRLLAGEDAKMHWGKLYCNNCNEPFHFKKWKEVK